MELCVVTEWHLENVRVKWCDRLGNDDLGKWDLTDAGNLRNRETNLCIHASRR